MRAAQKLRQLGQGVWLDNVMHDVLTTGTLARCINEVSVTALTSWEELSGVIRAESAALSSAA